MQRPLQPIKLPPIERHLTDDPQITKAKNDLAPIVLGTTVGMTIGLAGGPIGVLVGGIVGAGLGIFGLPIGNKKEKKNILPSWSADETGYRLSVNGEWINQRTKNEWRGNDLLVIDPVTQQCFLLEDYKNRKDNQIRSAKILPSWYADGTGYWLSVNGEWINQRTKNEWRGNDLLVIDPVTQQCFLLEDYKNIKDKQVRPAKIVNQ